MKTTTFNGLDCVELANEHLSLLVTESVGPRVLALHAGGGNNLFAELPDLTLDCPGSGTFHLYGGHRLWYTPEEPARTYLPDDDPVEIAPIDDGLLVTQPPEALTGIQKQMRIRLRPGAAAVDIEHTLIHRGDQPLTCAAWAITQLKTGGTALLPQHTALIDNNDRLPNRQITLWPYTDINSPHIQWDNQVIQIHAGLDDGALKIGFPNPRSWLAYWLAGTLFVKRAQYDPEQTYSDRQSSSQCYCNQHFIELETLGPIRDLQPGESLRHTETWQIHTQIEWPDNPAVLADLIETE